MPGENESLDFYRLFSPSEFEKIRIGLIPREMEDKWFIYYDNYTLHFHRSWTGHHIYKVVVELLNDNTYKTIQTIVNRNKAQYNQEDNQYDISLLSYLIDKLLLGKDVPFPTPTNLTAENKAIYKHSLVGYATPNRLDSIKDAPVSYDAAGRLIGCLVGGAIGDAAGSFYEGRVIRERITLDVLHSITDDTQLTMATCEAIIESGRVLPESIAQKMLAWYNAGKLTGLGASTLKALRDLQVGAHWALSGRSGEYAAGNGAAMRIAPLAFFTHPETDRTLIRDVCNITHKNDEAYVGCLAILYALHYIITDMWTDGIGLVELITPQLPDTALRDNLLKLQADPSIGIAEAASLVGTSGHVIESIPFSIFAAQKIKDSSFEDILAEVIQCGGDTDTNASLAGQMMGAYISMSGFSQDVLNLFARMKDSGYILDTGFKFSKLIRG